MLVYLRRNFPLMTSNRLSSRLALDCIEDDAGCSVVSVKSSDAFIVSYLATNFGVQGQNTKTYYSVTGKLIS
jgi:hypothetical protein